MKARPAGGANPVRTVPDSRAPAPFAAAGDLRLVDDILHGPIYSRTEQGDVIVVHPGRGGGR